MTSGWRRHLHRAGQLLVDASLVTLAWWLAFAFRFDGGLQGVYSRLFVATVGVVIGVKLLVFIGARFYTKWWRFTSVRDLQAIVIAVVDREPDHHRRLVVLAAGAPSARGRRHDAARRARPRLLHHAHARGRRALRRAEHRRAPRAGRARRAQGQGGADLRRRRRRATPCSARCSATGRSATSRSGSSTTTRARPGYGCRGRGCSGGRDALPANPAGDQGRRGHHRDAVGAGRGPPRDRRGLPVASACRARPSPACPS